MTSAIQIEVADERDAAELSALGRAVFIDTYGGTATDADIERHVDDYFGERSIRAEIKRLSVRYLIARADGACAGLVKLRDGAVPELISAASAVEVQQLYVSTNFQRLGVGHQLMDCAIEEAKAWGRAGVWLSVWTEADWATSFYEKYGFRRVAEIPFMLGTTEYTDYLMWLDFAGVA